MDFGRFGCLTRLGAKWARLAQKFVPRNRVEIFRNERTRSTPLDPKLMFCCVSYCLGAFETVWLPYETWCKTAELVQKFVLRSRGRIFCNKRTRSTPLDPKLKFCHILYYLGVFGTIVCLMKLGAKWAELVQKFGPRSRVGNFHNERTRSTPLDNELTYWCVSY